MTPLRRGMKVVCIDDQYNAEFAFLGSLVRKGAVYTISHIEAGLFPGHFGILLEEVDTNGWLFDSRRFRPAVERKTSIEIFQRMLLPKKQKEKV